MRDPFQEAAGGQRRSMTFDQIAALAVLTAVVGVLIHGRVRADVVALTGAATLLLLACPAELLREN